MEQEKCAKFKNVCTLLFRSAGWVCRNCWLFVFPSNWHVVFTAWWLPAVTILLTLEVFVGQGWHLTPPPHADTTSLWAKFHSTKESIRDKHVCQVHWISFFYFSKEKHLFEPSNWGILNRWWVFRRALILMRTGWYIELLNHYIAHIKLI